MTLTVTDDLGEVGETTLEVTVEAEDEPGEPVLVAQDDFERTETGGWGAAGIGGTWTRNGSASQYTVADGAGRLAVLQAGWNPRLRLAEVNSLDTEVRAEVSLDALGDGLGTYVSLTGRDGGWSSQYRGKLWIKADGTLNASVSRLQGGESTLAQVNLAGVAVAAEERVMLALETSGSAPTTVRLKVWPSSQPEPADWTVSATDATPELQDAGGVGVHATLSGSATNAPISVRLHSYEARSFD